MSLKNLKQTLTSLWVLMITIFLASCNEDGITLTLEPSSIPAIVEVTPTTEGVAVSWATAVIAGADIVNYEIIVESDGQQVLQIIVTGNPQNTLISGLPANSNLQFKIRSITAFGESAFSSLSATITTIPEVATSAGKEASITEIVPVSGGLRLFWTPPQLTTDLIGYQVTVASGDTEAGEDEDVEVRFQYNLDDPTLSRYKIIGLLPDNTYTATITPIYSDGFGAQTAFATTVSPLPSCDDRGSIRVGIAATGDLQVANADSPYATVLQRCIFNPICSESSSCATNELTFIGQDSTNPTIDNIMDHVLVQKPWMADRLREAIENMHPDALNLFVSITGIVVGDVRPSFYTTSTGAFYLDSAYLAVTAEHFRDVDLETPDFRSDFGSTLNFLIPSRLIASAAVNVSDPVVRSNLLVGGVLIHELIHSLDFFPPSMISGINRSTPIDQINFAGQRISDLLTNQYPLNSDVLSGLAAVRYLGDTATQAEEALNAQQVAQEFAPDGAVDWYNYTNRFEDLAMLGQRSLSFYLLGLSPWVAVASQGSCTSAQPIIVEWGQLNRFLEPQVRSRVDFLIESILDRASYNRVMQVLDGLPPPVDIQTGADWCDEATYGPPSMIYSANSKALLNSRRSNKQIILEIELPPAHLILH